MGSGVRVSKCRRGYADGGAEEPPRALRRSDLPVQAERRFSSHWRVDVALDPRLIGLGRYQGRCDQVPNERRRANSHRAAPFRQAAGGRLPADAAGFVLRRDAGGAEQRRRHGRRPPQIRSSLRRAHRPGPDQVAAHRHLSELLPRVAQHDHDRVQERELRRGSRGPLCRGVRAGRRSGSCAPGADRDLAPAGNRLLSAVQAPAGRPDTNIRDVERRSGIRDGIGNEIDPPPVAAWWWPCRG